MAEPNHLTDAELLKRSRSDPSAFRTLYDRYADEVFGFHLRRCGNREAALDLTAETFARAWLSRERFHDRRRGSIGPWLFGIARHVVLASIEQHRLERRAAERLGLSAYAQESVIPDETWSEELEQAFDQLPLTQRQAVRLRILDDMAYDEIGAQVGCSPLAARIRVSRGLSALRSRLTSFGLEIIR
jgi:RNA polymerase sigma factor (sigma-70 family)